MPATDPKITRAMRLHSGKLIGLLLDKAPTGPPSAPFVLSWAKVPCSLAGNGCPNCATVSIAPDKVVILEVSSSTSPGTPAVAFAFDGDFPADTPASITAYGSTAPIEDLAGKDIRDIPPEFVTMRCGNNMPRLSTSVIMPPYKDLGKIRATWFPGNAQTKITVDAKGNLTSVVGGKASTFLGTAEPNGNPTGKTGYPGLPSGRYTFKHDSPAGAPLLQNGVVIPSKLSAVDLAPAANSYAISIALSTASPVSNLSIYPPGEDPSGSIFNADFVDKVRRTGSCLRFMDSWATNGNAFADPSDIHSPDDTTYIAATKPQPSGKIVAIGPYDNAAGLLPVQDGWLYLQCTTDLPHGLITGRLVGLSGFTANATVTGPTTPASVPLNTINHMAVVVDDRNFALPVWIDTAKSSWRFVAAPLAGQFAAKGAPSMPLEDMIDLCMEANQDLWFNCPTLATDAFCDWAAKMLATRLSPHLKVHWEYSNEIWNNGNGFYAWWYALVMGKPLGLSFLQWGARRAGQTHNIGEAHLGDRLIRTFGSWYSSPPTTAAILKQAALDGNRVDAIAVAPYFDAKPTAPNVAALCDSLSLDQLMDISELQVAAGQTTRYMRGHVDAIKASAYPDAKLVCYEGGPENGAFATSSPNPQLRSIAWAVHPRMDTIHPAYLAALQDSGCSLYVDFILCQSVLKNNIWGRFNRRDQPMGVGDGSDGQFDNRTDFYARDKTVAVIAHAQARWEAARRANAN